MRVPILDLVRQYQAIKPDIDAAMLRVVGSGRFILGPEVEALEQEIAALCGAKAAIAVASGTDALLLSLRGLGVGPGDRVILPSFTFFATAGIVHNVGATPVFADVDRRTFNLAPDSVRAILEHESDAKAVRAIIPVHLYGQMASMDEIMAIAAEYGLFVVEDAAQAIGAEYQSGVSQAVGHAQLAHKAGTMGSAGCFSFFPTKNLGAYGDAGMIITGDDALAERVRMLRVHGSKPKYHHRLIGYNSRLDALQAAVLRVKLPHLAEWTAARQRIAQRYDRLLSGIKEIETPQRAADRTHIFHQYTIRVANDRRDDLRKHLKEKGIDTEVYYPAPLHLQECFRSLGYRQGSLPESEQASRDVLSLPIFPELTEDEQDYVVDAIGSQKHGQ